MTPSVCLDRSARRRVSRSGANPPHAHAPKAQRRAVRRRLTNPGPFGEVPRERVDSETATWPGDCASRCCSAAARPSTTCPSCPPATCSARSIRRATRRFRSASPGPAPGSCARLKGARSRPRFPRADRGSRLFRAAPAGSRSFRRRMRRRPICRARSTSSSRFCTGPSARTERFRAQPRSPACLTSALASWARRRLWTRMSPSGSCATADCRSRAS